MSPLSKKPHKCFSITLKELDMSARPISFAELLWSMNYNTAWKSISEDIHVFIPYHMHQPVSKIV